MEVCKELQRRFLAVQGDEQKIEKWTCGVSLFRRLHGELEAVFALLSALGAVAVDGSSMEAAPFLRRGAGLLETYRSSFGAGGRSGALDALLKHAACSFVLLSGVPTPASSVAREERSLARKSKEVLEAESFVRKDSAKSLFARGLKPKCANRPRPAEAEYSRRLAARASAAMPFWVVAHGQDGWEAMFFLIFNFYSNFWLMFGKL